jgi:hypothetical protein
VTVPVEQLALVACSRPEGRIENSRGYGASLATLEISMEGGISPNGDVIRKGRGAPAFGPMTMLIPREMLTALEGCRPASSGSQRSLARLDRTLRERPGRMRPEDTSVRVPLGRGHCGAIQAIQGA